MFLKSVCDVSYYSNGHLYRTVCNIKWALLLSLVARARLRVCALSSHSATHSSSLILSVDAHLRILASPRFSQISPLSAVSGDEATLLDEIGSGKGGAVVAGPAAALDLVAAQGYHVLMIDFSFLLIFCSSD